MPTIHTGEVGENMMKKCFAIGVAILGLAFSLSASAADPFTPTKSVCPGCVCEFCSNQEKMDSLKLADGSVVKGTVLAVNTAFYTVLRHGEVRAIDRSDVNSIEWSRGSQPSGLSDSDQLLLNSGHVVVGSILEDKDKPALFQVSSAYNEFTYIVFKSEVQKVYRNGQVQP
jgi:hypothetical protein